MGTYHPPGGAVVIGAASNVRRRRRSSTYTISDEDAVRGDQFESELADNHEYVAGRNGSYDGPLWNEDEENQ